MLKKCVMVIGICTCLSTPALSSDDPYLGISAGFTMPRDSDLSDSGITGKMTFDTGSAFSAALGLRTGTGRIEAEVGYKKADLKKITIDGVGSAVVNGDTTVLSVMGNGYIDFGSTSKVKPYIMGGIGGAKLSIKSSDMGVDEDDTVFAFQLGAGCGIVLGEAVTLDIGYRYMGTSDADYNGTKATYGSNNIMAGIRVDFR